MRVRYLAAALLASMLGAVGTGAIPVLAGSNGQEINYFEFCGHSYWSETWGYNQNGQYEDHYFEVAPNNSDPQCLASNQFQDAGWWWKGWVDVFGWQTFDGNQGSGNNNGDIRCQIPVTQQNGDYFDCQVPG